MAQHKIYKAMLSTGREPVQIGEVWKVGIEEVKTDIKNVIGVNPFYTIIIDEATEEIIFNRHVGISYTDLQKYNR